MMKQKMMKAGKWIAKHKFLFAVAVLLLGGSIYFGYSKTSETEEDGDIKTATVKRGDISIMVTGTGQVHAESQVNLKGVAAGDGIDVIEVAVKNDQEVQEDDLIAVLDTTEPMKSVRNAQLSLESTLISQKETEQLYDNKTVEEKWKRQTQEVAVQQKQSALNDAQSDLENYYIRAPFDGIVTGLSVEAGDSISRDEVIASVITREMYAEISLNEVDAVKVKEGNKVIITLDALSGTSMEGEVTKIDTIGEIVQNIVSYNAEISFEATNELIKPGMSVNAEIAVDSRENVFQVSNSAIKTSEDGSSYVQLMRVEGSAIAGEGPTQQFRIIKQTVGTGLTDDVITEITSGLKEGDIVITKMSASASNKAEENEAAGLLDSIRMRGTGGGRR